MEDNQGILWVVYESCRSSNCDIYSRKWNGNAWSQEERLTNSTASDQNPAIVQLTNSTVFLVWASDRSGGYSLYTKRLNGAAWSSETTLTTSPGRDSTPSVLQSRNGTLWVFFTRVTLSGNKALYDEYYKTYTNSSWSQDIPLANTTASELQQSSVESDDGTIWAVYSSDKSGNFELYYKKFNGVWSAETPLTANADDDRQAWIMQDLNGTLWVFWSRCVKSGATCQDDVFYKLSYNLGSTWSLETQFTFDPQGTEIFDSEPAAIHARDKRIYLFWTTNLFGDFDIYYSTSNPIPIHDVGILNATAYPAAVVDGEKAKVNITAANPGDYNETLHVDVYYQDVNSSTMTLFNSTILDVQRGRSTRIQLSWNTTGVVPSNYKISVFVQPVPGESPRRQYNNWAVAGNVTLLPRIVPGDLNGDGKVDIVDLVIVGAAFASQSASQNWNPDADVNRDRTVNIIDLAGVGMVYGSTPASANWNPNADINKDGRVDIIDLVLVGSAFGSNAPSPNWNAKADLNNDRRIDIVDLVMEALLMWR